MQCEYGSNYNHCGSSCQKTCFDNAINETCEANQCLEGCFCSGDKVMDDEGRCISPNECPCKENGIKYFNGQKFNIPYECKDW